MGLIVKALKVFFFFHPFHHWHCIRPLATHSNPFLDWRHLMHHAYSRSMKVSLQTGRQWRRTRHTPAFVVHLMLGSHSLVSTMMWQTSCHLSSSVQVCSLPLSVIYANWKSVLNPTMKDLYIKHYWAPQYQAIAMDNVHDIVSTSANLKGCLSWLRASKSSNHSNQPFHFVSISSIMPITLDSYTLTLHSPLGFFTRLPSQSRSTCRL